MERNHKSLRVICGLAAVTVASFATGYLSTSPSNWEMFSIERRSCSYNGLVPNTVFLEGDPFSPRSGRRISLYPPPQTDMAQQYQLFDDSEDIPSMEHRTFPRHDFNDPHCKPEPWQKMTFPTCNDIHGIGIFEDMIQQKTWILSSKGFWRDAWEYLDQGSLPLFANSTENYDHQHSVVLKTFKVNHGYEEVFFEYNRVDALVMERLTSSPFITDMYGFCGMAVIQEFAGLELSKVADKMHPLEKLNAANKVARGVAAIHHAGFVHNDLNFANIAFTNRKKSPILNDFNLGLIVLKHNETGKDCPFTHHFPNPQWRSPEEQVDIERNSPSLTKAIDVYALGNVLFRFATGRTPWKIGKQPRLTPQQKRAVSALKRNGTMPPVIFPNGRFERFQDDPATQALLTVMRDCYTFQPKKRPTAQQIVNRLQKAMHNLTHGPNVHKEAALLI